MQEAARDMRSHRRTWSSSRQDNKEPAPIAAVRRLQLSTTVDCLTVDCLATASLEIEA